MLIVWKQRDLAAQEIATSPSCWRAPRNDMVVVGEAKTAVLNCGAFRTVREAGPYKKWEGL